ncbi:MAG: hypothetical protein H3C35_13245 [Bacteroidetes bacterium]|nr:hypothetical protein [Bacteroidota bacterium]
MKKIISDTFKYIFNDNEWFNKILVGGMYIPAAVCGIGIIMINGFIVEFMKGIATPHSKMPYWRNSKHLFQTGWKVSAALFLYYGVAVGTALISGVRFFSVSMGSIFFVLLLTLHPLILSVYASHGTFVSCFTFSFLRKFVIQHWKRIIPSLLFSALFISVSLLFGWMWIVVGWPLLIFLSLLVQNGMLMVIFSSHLESHSS